MIFEAMGKLPHPSVSPVILVVLVVVFVFLLILAKAGVFNGVGEGAPETGVSGSGRSFQCHRCGTWFQPEKQETRSDGNERHWVDDRCPHCGWDKDWTDNNHNNRPDHYE